RHWKSVCAITMSPTQEGPTIRIFIKGSFKPQATSRKLQAVGTTCSLRLAAFSSVGLLDQGTPLGVSGSLAGHQVEVGFLKLLGHRTTAADADLAAIHF